MKPHFITIAGFPVRSWMVTAFLAAASVAYVALIFVPSQRSIRGLRLELGEKQQHVLQSDRLTAPIRQAELRLASTREYSTTWSQSAPRPTDLVNVYAQLTDAAKGAGVEVQRIDPQPAIELQTIGQHPVSINLSGQFPQVFDFVRRIESLPQTIWIRDLRIARSSGDSETLQIELSLTIFSDRTQNAD